MAVRSFVWKALVLAALGCMVCGASVRAQEPEPAPVEGVPPPAGVPDVPGSNHEVDLTGKSSAELDALGGDPELSNTYNYTHPLKQFGTDLFVGSYALNLFVSLAYLAVVYPLQALFGSNKVETVTLWMFLPIAGPWFAQYEDSVKSKPFWRVVLIGDAAVQATGLVLGLIGYALSGKRTLDPETTKNVELSLGVQGAGLAGVTLTVRAL